MAIVVECDQIRFEENWSFWFNYLQQYQYNPIVWNHYFVEAFIIRGYCADFGQLTTHLKSFIQAVLIPGDICSLKVSLLAAPISVLDNILLVLVAAANTGNFPYRFPTVWNRLPVNNPGHLLFDSLSCPQNLILCNLILQILVNLPCCLTKTDLT